MVTFGLPEGADTDTDSETLSDCEEGGPSQPVAARRKSVHWDLILYKMTLDDVLKVSMLATKYCPGFSMNVQAHEHVEGSEEPLHALTQLLQGVREGTAPPASSRVPERPIHPRNNLASRADEFLRDRYVRVPDGKDNRIKRAELLSDFKLYHTERWPNELYRKHAAMDYFARVLGVKLIAGIRYYSGLRSRA